MYYAACCCDRPPPACNCGDKQYASVSLIRSFSGGEGPYIQRYCDRICSRGAADSYHDHKTHYCEIKIYMKCDPSIGSAGYNSAAVSPSRKTFDDQSLVVLYTEDMADFRIFTRPFIPNCCDPPDNNHCGPAPEGLYTSLTTRTATLLPFDPLDLSFPFVLDPDASTFVGTGSFIQNQIPVDLNVELDPNTWYRKTSCALGFKLPARRFEYVKPYTGAVETSVTDFTTGGPFGIPIRLEATKISEIGSECDPHDPGSEVITFAGNREVPSDNLFNSSGPNDCREQTEGLACCGSGATVTSPAGQTQTDFTVGNEIDGGIFSLEFSDDPSPFLP